MAGSYLSREDDTHYYVQTPSGQEIGYAKIPNYDIPNGMYDVAKRAAVGVAPAGAAPTVAPTDSASQFNTVPRVAFPPPPVELPPMKPQVSQDEVARQAAAQPKQQPSVGMGAGPGIVQLGSTQSITERPIVDPKAMASYEAEQRKIGDATQKRAEAEGKIALEKGNAATQQATLKEQMVAAREEGAKKAEQQFNEYQSKYDELYKDYAETKIQPKGYFEGDLGSNVMAGIGIMLGAVGGSLQGSNRNMAVEVMDRAIDRDIEAQKVNLAKKGEALSMLGVRYQAARQAGFDDLQAKMLAKADAYDAIAAYTEAKVAPLQGTIVEQNGLMEAAKLRADSQRFKVEATKGSQKTVITKEDKAVEKAKAEKLPESADKDVRGAIQMHDALNDLRELVELKDTASRLGPFDSRVMALKQKFGLQDVADAELDTNIRMLVQDRGHQISGAGMSDKERESIQASLPGLIDNPQSFLAKIDTLDEKNAQYFYRVRDLYPNSSVNYPELKSPGAERARIKLYGKPSTFKPAGK